MQFIRMLLWQVNPLLFNRPTIPRRWTTVVLLDPEVFTSRVSIFVQQVCCVDLDLGLAHFPALVQDYFLLACRVQVASELRRKIFGKSFFCHVTFFCAQVHRQLASKTCR